ncbi:hypothetical protein AOU00_13320 [Paenibacillus polymyxa]|nr:hypothetical protein AOU00_13320 [Paenibacillus polymyxa]KYG92914.1 hypothetical protein AZE31_03445 [Paenibacillus polymyxa]
MCTLESSIHRNVIFEIKVTIKITKLLLSVHCDYCNKDGWLWQMFHCKKLQKKSAPNVPGTDLVNSIQLCVVCASMNQGFSTDGNEVKNIKAGLSFY